MKKYCSKIKTYFTEDKTIFAKGYCGKKIFFIFVIFSIFGAYYEEILTLTRTFLRTGVIEWQARRGVLYGPFSPIYGAGAVLLYVFLGKKESLSWLKTFFYGSIFGGVFEYLISLLQEIFTGTTSWDYSHHILNIGGRTTIIYMMFWGILTVLFLKILCPILSRLLEKIPNRIGNYITVCLAVFLFFDCLISWTALIRSYLRREQIEPITPVGRLYDKIYPDTVLQESFPNMNFQPKGAKK